MIDRKDKKKADKLKGVGLSVAAILSALLLIQPWEGEVVNKHREHVAYVDTLGRGSPITYCNGLTGRDMFGHLPKAGDKYTQGECDYMLALRVKRFEEDVVSAVRMFNSPLAKVNNRFASEYQKAAIISFTYNLGINSFRTSTMLKLLNAGEHEAACDELVKWVFSNGKKLKGLENRRNEEREWCMGAVPDRAKSMLDYLIMEK